LISDIESSDLESSTVPQAQTPDGKPKSFAVKVALLFHSEISWKELYRIDGVRQGLNIEKVKVIL